MNIKQIAQKIEEGIALKSISQAYTEIATNKLKKIRAAVERNRDYLEDLSKVHQIVKQVALAKHILPQKNGRSISLLITSNYHFYGNVNNNLMKYYLDTIKNQKSDQFVIGKTAIEYFNSINYPKNYQSLILKTDSPTDIELQQLSQATSPYSQVIIYYSQLKSVMVQIPTSKDITQTSFLKLITELDESISTAFIFEPEIEKTLEFFETQVTNLLLEQTFLESELSRTASRLISMDQAQTNADKYIVDNKKMLGMAKNSINNNKLLETFNAIASLRRSTYDQI